MQTILVVDDEPDILESLKPLLESGVEGVQVRTAPGGREALEVLARERVDLIMSDYRMPGMNGLDFLDEARRRAPGVPSMLITAYPDLEIAIRAINDAGVESFITKPFKVEEVLDQVKAALFRRRVDRLFKDQVGRRLGAAPGGEA